jgi:hypothetical protein
MLNVYAALGAWFAWHVSCYVLSMKQNTKATKKASNTASDFQGYRQGVLNEYR